MTKKELVEKLSAFSDDSEVVIERQGAVYAFQLDDSVKQFICLQCYGNQSFVMHHGVQYKVSDICKLLPEVEVKRYASEYDCALANVVEYARMIESSTARDLPCGELKGVRVVHLTPPEATEVVLNRKYLDNCNSLMEYPTAGWTIVDVMLGRHVNYALNFAQSAYTLWQHGVDCTFESVAELLRTLPHYTVTVELVDSLDLDRWFDYFCKIYDTRTEARMYTYVIACWIKKEVVDTDIVKGYDQEGAFESDMRRYSEREETW